MSRPVNCRKQPCKGLAGEQWQYVYGNPKHSLWFWKTWSGDVGTGPPAPPPPPPRFSRRFFFLLSERKGRSRLCSFHLGESRLRNCTHNPFIAAWLSAGSSSKVGRVDLAASPCPLTNLSSVSIRFPSGSFQGHLVAPYLSISVASTCKVSICFRTASVCRLHQAAEDRDADNRQHPDPCQLQLVGSSCRESGSVSELTRECGGKSNGAAC